MIKICFVCLGNICRSPMAEFIMKDVIKNKNLEDKFYITSKGTSNEEEGNDLYYLAKEKLKSENIPFSYHCASKLEKDDYDKFDYFICMEESNIRNALRIFKDDPLFKVKKLLEYDVDDPWYTNDFDKAFNDISKGINDLINKTSV